jgi:vacuolar-type H+-ATPase subunit I/STV1
MTTHVQPWKPGGSIKALLDQLYDIKFSKHTPLVVVLLSMVWTVYRTYDYLSRAFNLPGAIALPAAAFIELLILAASASLFIALRTVFISQLREVDQLRAWVGVGIASLALAASFLALLFVAWADAWALTHEYVPSVIMSLIQGAQMLFMCGFIIAADNDEREKLRDQFAGHKVNTAQQQAGQCPHCFRAVAPNNRARHMAVCPMRPHEES